MRLFSAKVNLDNYSYWSITIIVLNEHIAQTEITNEKLFKEKKIFGQSNNLTESFLSFSSPQIE